MTLYDSHTLSLYCDNAHAVAISPTQEATAGEHHWCEFPTMFHGQSGAACRQQAQQSGWKFFRNGRNLCPRCARHGIKLRKQR